MDILVIPDAHANPESDNTRAEVLGEFIVDRKPDLILDLGDLASMDSLSSYDKGKRRFEGRRYIDDINSAIDFQERLFAPLEKYNGSHKKQYHPQKELVLGNHEDRIERATQDAAELYGFIGVDDLKYEEFGWKVHPFKKVVEIEGVLFAHYFESGVMGRAISGINIGRSMINKTMASCIQGHSHLLSIATDVTADNRRIWGISAGCFLEHQEPYVSERIQQSFWKGVLYLSNVKDGDFDLETIKLETLRREYGRA